MDKPWINMWSAGLAKSLLGRCQKSSLGQRLVNLAMAMSHVTGSASVVDLVTQAFWMQLVGCNVWQVFFSILWLDGSSSAPPISRKTPWVWVNFQAAMMQPEVLDLVRFDMTIQGVHDFLSIFSTYSNTVIHSNGQGDKDAKSFGNLEQEENCVARPCGIYIRKFGSDRCFSKCRQCFPAFPLLR